MLKKYFEVLTSYWNGKFEIANEQLEVVNEQFEIADNQFQVSQKNNFKFHTSQEEREDKS